MFVSHEWQGLGLRLMKPMVCDWGVVSPVVPLLRYIERRKNAKNTKLC